MTKRELFIDEKTESWIEAQDSADSARACLRYALAFNLLDASWLENQLSPFITYDSQSVHMNGSAMPLRGISAVSSYWSGKIETLRRTPARQPLFELATTSFGETCVAGYLPTGDFDQNWLQKPLVNLTLTTDADGLITIVLMAEVNMGVLSVNSDMAILEEIVGKPIVLPMAAVDDEVKPRLIRSVTINLGLNNPAGVETLLKASVN